MVESAAALHQVQLEADEDDRSPPAARAGWGRGKSRRMESISFLPPGHQQSDTATGGAEDDSSAAIFTVNEAIDHIGFGRFQGALLMYAGLAWAADAMEMMLLSFLGPAVRCSWGLSATQESLITSVVFLGTMAGANMWGALSDARGRRVGFQACSISVFVFGLLSAASPSYGWLLAARFLVGIGLGGVPVAFALFAEFCPLKGRGGWLVLLQAFWTVGSMAEAALAWRVLVPLGWRTLLALSALPFVLLLALYPLLPESPHYLVVHGRLQDARAVLDRMARCNGRPLPHGDLVSDSRRSPGGGAKALDEEEGRADANYRLSATADLPSQVANGVLSREEAAIGGSKGTAAGVDNCHHGGDKAGSTGSPESGSPADSAARRLAEARAAATAAVRPEEVRRRVGNAVTSVRWMVAQLLSPVLRRTTLLLLFIWFANAISYYGLVLLATTIHVSDSRTACRADGAPNLSNEAFKKIFLTSTAELPGMVVAAVLVEVFSRKRTLAGALAVTAACTAALVLDPAQLLLWGSRAGIMGSFAVLFIYTPEVFPTTIRSLGLGVTNSFSRIGAVVSPFVAVALVQAGHVHIAEGLFALFCLAAAVAALCLPIETKGRALAAEAEPPDQAIALPVLDREGPERPPGVGGGLDGPGLDGPEGAGRQAGLSLLSRSDSDGSAFSLVSLGSEGDAEAGLSTAPGGQPPPSSSAPPAASPPPPASAAGTPARAAAGAGRTAAMGVLANGSGLAAEDGGPQARTGLLRPGAQPSGGPHAEDRR